MEGKHVSAPKLQAIGNYAIRKLRDDPRHEFNQVAGCPADWPTVVDYIGDAETSPWAGRTVIAAEALGDLYESLLDQFATWYNDVWKPFIQSKADSERATNNTFEDELRTLLTNLRTAYQNWDTLTLLQKDAVHKKCIRAIGLLFQLGKVS